MTDSWNYIRDPELAEAVGEYATGAFPGGLIDCEGPDGWACPLSPGVLPPDGVLYFRGMRWSTPNTVAMIHKVYVSVDEAVAARRASGMDESVTEEFPSWFPDGWILSSMLYRVEVERLANGAWRVGKARDECCI